MDNNEFSSSSLCNNKKSQPLILPRLLSACISGLLSFSAIADPQPLRPDITLAKIIDTKTVSPSVRLARFNVGGKTLLYVLKLNGDIYEVNPFAQTANKIYSSAQHQIQHAQGFAIGSTGTFYLVGNEDMPNKQTRATIVKGVYDKTTRQRAWSILARTAAYPKSGFFDHQFNGIIVGPAGNFIFVNSGSRTDHGEIQSAGGLYPNTREVGLTACILQLPANGLNISLPNDRAALKAKGYVFAEGTRNTFDFAFTANGHLLGTENGPDRDMPDELNWLRPGLHYGFPWRFGNEDNPQQFASYVPWKDKLLDKRYTAVKNWFYRNDPAFPPKPARIMVDAISNAGPDADSFRDPVDGVVKDSSALGKRISSFTPHRSPLGLVVNKGGAVSNEFKYDAFMLSWNAGDPLGNAIPGPFLDPSQDLFDLDLVQGATNYSMRAKRIVSGFKNPIDAEMIANSIYVLEFGGTQAIWKVTLPAQ